MIVSFSDALFATVMMIFLVPSILAVTIPEVKDTFYQNNTFLQFAGDSCSATATVWLLAPMFTVCSVTLYLVPLSVSVLFYYFMWRFYKMASEVQ